MAEQDKASASNLLDRWISGRLPLFRRLALHALTEDPKSDIRLVEGLLLKGRKPGLWDLELRREVLRFLRKAGRRLPRDLLTKLKKAIVAGPTKNVNLLDDRDKARNQREIGWRLNNLRESGVRLNKSEAGIVDQLQTSAERLAERRYEFLSWISVGWVGREEGAPRHYLSEPPQNLAEAIVLGNVSPDEFESLTFMNIKLCHDALSLVTMEPDFPMEYWRRFLWRAATLRREQKLEEGITERIASSLMEMPDTAIVELGSAVGDFINHLAKIYDIDRESEFSAVWHKAFSGGRHEYELDSVDDALTQALNHTYGKLAESALERLWLYKPTSNGGLPPEVTPYFDELAAHPPAHLGRIILVTRLFQLFGIDPDWTSEHLLSRMARVETEEGMSLWIAYGWSPTVGPNLLAAYKESFLAVLPRLGVEGSKEENLVNLFEAVCIDAPGKLSEKEISDVTGELSNRALATIIEKFVHRFEADGVEPVALWKERIGPWLRRHWPRVAEKHSQETSQAFVRLLCAVGPAFPVAYPDVLPNITEVTDDVYYRLRKSDLPENYPEETLNLLHKLVPDRDHIASWVRGQIKENLDRIVASREGLAANPVFQELYRRVTD